MNKFKHYCIYSLLICTCFFTFKAHAFWELFGSRCDEFTWTKEDSRTQAGGWVWFPGKGVALDRETAVLLAEGNALTLLNQECQFPHKEVKAHERCVEEVSGNFKAYIRYSLLEQQCKETKYASAEKKNKIENKVLLSTLDRYKKLTNQSEEKTVESCEVKGMKTCYDYGKYEYFMGERAKAQTFFDLGCKNGHQQSCFNAGVVAWEMGDIEKATKYLDLQCHQNDYQACHLLGELSRSRDAEKSKKSLEKACDNNWGESCLSLAENFSKPELYEKACTLKTANACQRASTYYWDKNDKALSQHFASEGCKQASVKACFNLAMIFETTNTESKKAHLKVACDGKLALACYELSLLSSEKEKEKYYQKSCDLGEGRACSELALILFDNKKNDESLFYSKCACKLGVYKSCHNAGYFEYSKGDKESAQVHLASACDNGISESCKLLKEFK